MDCCPELRKRRSCACPPLHIGNWCNGRRCVARAMADDCDEEFDSLNCRPTQSRWRGLWRRIVKEKRRMLNSANPTHLPYDPYTYAQNFDEGSASVEPDNLSRSFSVRVDDGPPLYAVFFRRSPQAKEREFAVILPIPFGKPDKMWGGRRRLLNHRRGRHLHRFTEEKKQSKHFFKRDGFTAEDGEFTWMGPVRTWDAHHALPKPINNLVFAGKGSDPRGIYRQHVRQLVL
ncbi:hypothetical protein B296_00018597 [Ensete ventricosum]|uniref:Uncharacterized protein n=1 Tax=Ensete ventricosum TaxID=4639 RepID=A0A426Z252_ENSVE|nr:hypothetical protein B296_00018597 [Ensete ventricosum]